MNKVGVVVCYYVGTKPMLRACLRSISRHLPDEDMKLYLVYRTTDSFDSFDEIDRFYGTIEVVPVDSCTSQPCASRIHGEMLDNVIPRIDAENILTLDSDCFPVADGWLSEMVSMIDNPDVGVAGILHPWSPPPVGLNTRKTSIEYRIRSQHCWNNTHVACQLINKEILMSLGVGFLSGDDTGLLIPSRVRALGMKVAGWKPTRCPKSSDDYDEELNRYLSIVYGDRMYHHGQYTREEIKEDDHFGAGDFGDARKRVINECGAEFLLDDNESHKFRFDMEEEVAKSKLSHMMGFKEST